MYRWRQLSDEQRTELLELRGLRRQPWHSPPHREAASTDCYLVTASCYEHADVIGQSALRMAEFESFLLEVLRTAARVDAWCVLPNHYHALVQTPVLKKLLWELGRMHGRLSHRWNVEDGSAGRKVWYNIVERAMKSGRHHCASLNYVHHNAVHHGYVELWTDWPFSSATDYLNSVGRDEALRTWREFPVLDYGEKWDPPEM